MLCKAPEQSVQACVVSSEHDMTPALTILMPCCCMLLLLIVCSPRIRLVGRILRRLCAVVCWWLMSYRLLLHTGSLRSHTGFQAVITKQVCFLF